MYICLVVHLKTNTTNTYIVGLSNIIYKERNKIKKRNVIREEDFNEDITEGIFNPKSLLGF